MHLCALRVLFPWAFFTAIHPVISWDPFYLSHLDPAGVRAIWDLFQALPQLVLPFPGLLRCILKVPLTGSQALPSTGLSQDRILPFL